MLVRINKFLADQGIASRRAIDVLISQKRVTVNGVLIDKPGLLVKEKDAITIDGRRVATNRKDFITILFNKPTGCITTNSDTHGRKTVLDYVSVGTRVFPVGRLDKNTTGILLLTNDGELAHRLMHPRSMKEKVYRAHLAKALAEKDRKTFESGIVLDGKKTAPCSIRFFRDDERDVVVTLHEGRNRQIHRMFGALGYDVLSLDRIAYAGLTIGNLQRGEWRHLTEREVEQLKREGQV